MHRTVLRVSVAFAKAEDAEGEQLGSDVWILMDLADKALSSRRSHGKTSTPRRLARLRRRDASDTKSSG